MVIREDGKTVRAMDILFPGIGEVVGGSQREERLDVLKEKIKKAPAHLQSKFLIKIFFLHSFNVRITVRSEIQSLYWHEIPIRIYCGRILGTDGDSNFTL